MSNRISTQSTIFTEELLKNLVNLGYRDNSIMTNKEFREYIIKCANDCLDENTWLIDELKDFILKKESNEDEIADFRKMIIMLMNEHNIGTCQNCKVYHDSNVYRSYPWLCVPKKKYNQAAHKSTFDILLCVTCFDKTSNCKSVSGHDWWDAMDYLDYNYFKEQSYRDFYDENTRKIFGFNSIEELRAKRENNMKELDEKLS